MSLPTSRPVVVQAARLDESSRRAACTTTRGEPTNAKPVLERPVGATKRMSPSRAIVGLGEVLWDLLPAGPQLGGAPFNFTFHCHQLGHPAVMVSRVGADDLG